MRVSIITPSYNQAKYLETTIRSVFGQEYEELEYFIIDGGSTDGSVDIIRKYEKYLAGWVSEPDKGQADAINKGLQKATGEIIAWLNSDDAYAPGAIHSAVELFLQKPEFGLIYGNAVSIDQNGIPFHIQTFKNYQLEDLIAFNIICQPAVFFRKKLLDDVGYLDESYHFLLDHHLWLRIAQYTKIFHVPEIWAFARYHPGAKNITLATEFGKEALRILEWMKSQSSLVEIVESDQEKVMAMFHRFVGRYLLDGGQGWSALKSYLRSFQAEPGIAMKEWHRILFAVLSILGLRVFSKYYYGLQRRFFSLSPLNISDESIDKLYSDFEA
jgi:glycosyltransferase involved in cell wall biosynthesis